MTERLRERVSDTALRALTYAKELREDLQTAWFSGRYGRINAAVGVGLVVGGVAILTTSLIIGPGNAPYDSPILGTFSVLIGILHLDWLKRQLHKS